METTELKKERVRDMFGAIARRYDLANHVLSCGIDFYWRRRAAAIVAGWTPTTILDVATGTGDLALALQRKLPGAEVTAIDLVSEMVELARRKGVQTAVIGDAMNLGYADRTFDCVTIAFGLRNLPDFGGGLREVARVLKTGGHVLVLDFSIPQLPILRSAYRLYLHRCMPWIGSVITRKRTAYDYLGDSIEEFPAGEAMLRLLTANGFEHARSELLTGGIAAIYVARRT